MLVTDIAFMSHFLEYTKNQIAVIVPVYNVEKYIHRCMDSLIKQTYSNLQIICVNDGSDDHGGDILDYYANLDSRIVVIHKENGGVSSARNAGLDLILENFKNKQINLPEYISFVDPDDSLDLDTFRSAVSNFSEDIDLVCFGYELLKENSEYIEKDRYRYSNKDKLSGKHPASSSVINNTTYMVTERLHKASIIFDYDIRFPNISLAEDGFFSAAYMLHCRTIYFDNSFYYKCLLRQDSATSSNSLKQKNKSHQCTIAYLTLLSYIKKLGLYEEKKDVFWGFFFFMVCMGINISNSEQDDAILYKAAQKTISTEPLGKFTVVQNHIRELIESENLKEYKLRKFYGLLKIKHRITFDKYYICEIPLVKVAYTEQSKVITIFNTIKKHI
ncbi:glycosyltransferase family 2 protein [Anaerobiospirillum succiniciproducens]|uniref:glycosyltransferase family 2 protein n=2 Tax=Anaerobiospirillum succiniciproducens TaxID=13335 RepID=UPI003F8B2ED4